MHRKNAVVVLIDDSADDVELAVTILSDSYPIENIMVLYDGAEARDYLLRRGRYADRDPANPILVLLDIKMPKVDGLEVLKTIKSDDKLKIIPVVMLTSSREEKDVSSSYRLGANAYVVKPVEFTDYRSAIERLAGFWLGVNEYS